MLIPYKKHIEADYRPRRQRRLDFSYYWKSFQKQRMETNV